MKQKLKRMLLRVLPLAAYIFLLTMPQVFAVEDMWTAANRIIVDVYNKIAGISTVLAGTGRKDVNPYRFSLTDFPASCVKDLDHTPVCSAAFSLTAKKFVCENCSHLPVRNFPEYFGTEDAAGLAPGKDDKPEGSENGRWQAARVRILSA